MKRTFIAFDIYPSEITLASCNEIRRRLRLEKISWVDDKQFHITVSFLGDTPDNLIQPVTDRLQTELGQLPGFKITLKGLGLFRSIHEPKVLWMGSQFGPVLPDIKDKLDKIFIKFGLNTDHRHFSPHLTLGRIKFIRQINTLSELLTTYKDRTFQEDRIKSIVWYESILSSKGPEYKPLSVFPLKA